MRRPSRNNTGATISSPSQNADASWDAGAGSTQSCTPCMRSRRHGPTQRPAQRRRTTPLGPWRAVSARRIRLRRTARRRSPRSPRARTTAPTARACSLSRSARRRRHRRGTPAAGPRDLGDLQRRQGRLRGLLRRRLGGVVLTKRTEPLPPSIRSSTPMTSPAPKAGALRTSPRPRARRTTGSTTATSSIRPVPWSRRGPPRPTPRPRHRKRRAAPPTPSTRRRSSRRRTTTAFFATRAGRGPGPPSRRLFLLGGRGRPWPARPGR